MCAGCDMGINKSGLTELFRARDASCPKGRKMEIRKSLTTRNLAKECDCMKKKFFVVIAIIVVLVILLTPIRMNLKDGGSVRYKALVYEVTIIHQLAPEVDGVKPYIDGFEIKILGMTVYRETNE